MNLTAHERYVIALCRAHREWPDGDNVELRELTLRTLREAMQGILNYDIVGERTLTCLERVVDILVRGAPMPLGEEGLGLLRQAADDLLTARMDVDEDFRMFFIWLWQAPDAVPHELPPVVQVLEEPNDVAISQKVRSVCSRKARQQ